MRLQIVCAVAIISLKAQSPQASITGIVTDGQEAVIAGARVVAVHAQTASRTEVRTNSSGLFSLRPLPIGAYEIAVEMDGFRKLVQKGLVLTTGQNLELNFRLELGLVSESVSVSASASTLETRTSEVAQLVESKTIEDMPLGDRRSMNMVNIVGGAVFVNYDAGAKPNFSLAGGRTQSQMLWLDGGSGQNMRLGVGQMDMDPPVEVVQEVKIVANNYSAEFGGSAGGVIITTTKSGTNQLRGSLFEYLRNDKLDAPNFFAPVSGTAKQKATLRYNVFGGTVGGKIIRDKTFYFFAYEGSRRFDGSTRTLTVPSTLQRLGDFSETRNAAGALIPVYDPATTRQEGTRFLRTTFPGNRIPRDRFDPVAVNLIPFYPVANRAPDNISGANNFRANGGLGLTRDNYTAKLDHHFSSRDHVTARWLYNSDNRKQASVYPERAAETVGDQPAHQQYAYGAWTRLLRPTLVNDFRFNYGRRFADAQSNGLGGGWPSKIGLKGVPDDAFPTIAAAGFANLGSGTHRRLSTPITNLQFVNNLSWVSGRHSLKFGFDTRGSHITDQLRQSVSGNFTFSVLPTGLPGTANTGNGFATLLLGFPTAFQTRDTPALRRFSQYLSGFAQDDWTIRRGLTLNLGLRWEMDTPIFDADNRMNGFDPAQINPVSGTPGVVKFAGVNGWRTRPYARDWNNFSPRVGFAWQPFNEKTVVRGGYGIVVAHPFDHGAPTSASLGYEISSSLNTPDNGITAPFFLRNGVPVSASSPRLDDSFGAVRIGQNPTTAVTFFETNRRSGYAQHFTLGVQREVTAGTVVEVSYVANLARKLAGTNLSINQIRPERLVPGAAQRDRPFPQFSDVSVVFPSLGVSSYHAGVVRVERRFSAGFNLLATYTYSKFLNNVDEGGATLGAEGGTYSNLYNRRADWGPSENDVRSRFTFSSVYEVPFGRNAASKPVRWIAGGWSIGGTATVQSGAPFNVTTLANSTNAFSAGALRADVTANPSLGSPTLARWFDTAAFRQPAPFAFGNQGMNILRADGRTVINLSLLRNFAIHERVRIQLRGEFFNAPNHPNFGVPGRVFGAPGFGVVNSAAPARQIQLGLRLVF
ncbi:MAG: TonB-dependent receptor [Acidobacteria bacterium]|nr:TonB-dependent receptor [Acidobacteriota bacterium]